LDLDIGIVLKSEPSNYDHCSNFEQQLSVDDSRSRKMTRTTRGQRQEFKIFGSPSNYQDIIVQLKPEVGTIKRFVGVFTRQSFTASRRLNSEISWVKAPSGASFQAATQQLRNLSLNRPAA
jgi:hypothetical protein